MLRWRWSGVLLEDWPHPGGRLLPLAGYAPFWVIQLFWHADGEDVEVRRSELRVGEALLQRTLPTLLVTVGPPSPANRHRDTVCHSVAQAKEILRLKVGRCVARSLAHLLVANEITFTGYAPL
ncbi:hypothetical protein AXF42_Ash021280 [Apostasia shenzhenica]|uniref:Uncharacterized protein n=1 Tax=Apostasia shenzhenica TaxID=1088818 RepID=A0A2I0AVT7_9ASPA|nr:hypothetical protein AXF42_Ash021280 [Apostasia shenzhenica]